MNRKIQKDRSSAEQDRFANILKYGSNKIDPRIYIFKANIQIYKNEEYIRYNIYNDIISIELYKQKI